MSHACSPSSTVATDVLMSSDPSFDRTHIDELGQARLRAAKDPGAYPSYSWEALERMESEFTRSNGGTELYDWQRNVGEALLLGLDCTVIAGTNAGKTVSIILPLLAAPPGKRRTVLLLSSLEHLQAEQVITLPALVI
jgi:ATP-dependent helicase YprA (DUF1998 family)